MHKHSTRTRTSISKSRHLRGRRVPDRGEVAVAAVGAVGTELMRPVAVVLVLDQIHVDEFAYK